VSPRRLRNPLAMAAARAMLTEVATDRAYARIEALRQRAAAGISAAIKDFRINGFVVTSGAKGCVVFSAAGVRDYRGFLMCSWFPSQSRAAPSAGRSAPSKSGLEASSALQTRSLLASTRLPLLNSTSALDS